MSKEMDASARGVTVIIYEVSSELRKQRVEIYREMSENDDVVGAILYAIEMLVQQTD